MTSEANVEILDIEAVYQAGTYAVVVVSCEVDEEGNYADWAPLQVGPATHLSYYAVLNLETYVPEYMTSSYPDACYAATSLNSAVVAAEWEAMAEETVDPDEIFGDLNERKDLN